MHRGLYVCEKTKKKLNADLNAAVNIVHRAGYEVMIKKIKSYRVTHRGVRPVTPYRRGQARPHSETQPLWARRGHRLI